MDITEAANMLEAVDARTRLVGSNKMEILLFSLGSRETYGINVFKVREVTKTPKITRTPNMPSGVEGVISLRGNIIPVIDLARFAGLADPSQSSRETMVITEYSRHTQAFLVHDVEHIIRVDWDQVKPPEQRVASSESPITAVTRLEDSRLVSILDVEHVLAQVYGETLLPEIVPVSNGHEHTVFYVDDSMVARREISMVLEKLGVKSVQATNGREAWDRLQAMAARADVEGTALSSQIGLILADAEMPEMDGYVLTKLIKGDARFAQIPVVMHSSLSSTASRAMGQSVGVDAYVAKFDASVLAETLRPMLARAA
jgi:two-component system, chemotaxis family, chemotaxis protein CheV